MGGGSSKQNVQVEVANELFSSVIASALQQCTSAARVEQSISVSNSSGGIISGNSQTQSYSLSTNCQMDQNQLNALRAEITNNIQNAGEQNTQALLSAINSLMGGGKNQDMSTAIRNAVNYTVSASLVQNISSSINQRQSISVSGSTNVEIRNNVQSQAADVILSATSEQVQQTELLQRVQSIVDQQAQQNEKNPVSDIVDSIGGVATGLFDGLSGLFGGSSGAMIVILIVCVAAAMLYMRGGMGSGMGMGYMPQQSPPVIVIGSNPQK